MTNRRWTWGAVVAMVVLVAALGCSHQAAPGEEEEPFIPRPPVPVHVKNENFNDVNVAAVIGGVARRLGTVNGNASADFVIGSGLASGQTVQITATPIGGRGVFATPQMSVAPGQMIEVRVGSVLRQSVATVHDP